MIDVKQTGLSVGLLDKLSGIFSNYPSVKQVKLYGSRAKGNFRHSSDIDLTFIGRITHDELMGIDALIDDLLTPYTYDLSILADIDNHELLEHIERVGLVIYPFESFNPLKGVGDT